MQMTTTYAISITIESESLPLFKRFTSNEMHANRDKFQPYMYVSDTTGTGYLDNHMYHVTDMPNI